MTSKIIQCLALASIPWMVFSGAIISGEFNTSVGYIAGQNAIGNRATVVGAGSGGESFRLMRSTMVGAASGVYAQDVHDSVSIGYRSMRNASNINHVVAIGSHELEGASSIRDTLSLNNQLVVRGDIDSFFVRPQTDKPQNESPIFYQEGKLYVNAQVLMRASGMLGSEIIEGPSEEARQIYDACRSKIDFFVDSVHGNDASNGMSRVGALHSLNTALAKFATWTNRNVGVIGMLAGDYEPIDSFATQNITNKNFRVVFVSLGEVGQVRIQSSRELPSFSGDSSDFCAYFGVTFSHLTSTGQVVQAGLFQNCIFVNCIFEHIKVNITPSKFLFLGCALNGCDMRSSVFVGSDNSYTNSLSRHTYYNLIGSSNVENSRLTWSVDTNYSSFVSGLFDVSLKNSFVHMPVSVFHPYKSSSPSTLLGDAGDWEDSTVIIDELINTNYYAYARSYPIARNCLLGLPYAHTNGVHTILREPSELKQLLNQERRPKRVPYRWYGYGSGEDRQIIEAIKEELKND